jgi:hypothetical protein
MVLNKAFEFPTRLHDLLEQAEERGYGDVISWVDENGFKIHDKEKLVPILNQCFRITKFKSFLRQLQAWGFRRVHFGPNKGLCTHALFKRGDRSLSASMKRRYSNNTSERTKASPAVTTMTSAKGTMQFTKDTLSEPSVSPKLPQKVSLTNSVMDPNLSLQRVLLSSQMQPLVNNSTILAGCCDNLKGKTHMFLNQNNIAGAMTTNVAALPFQTFSNFENRHVPSCVPSPMMRALQSTKNSLDAHVHNINCLDGTMAGTPIPHQLFWQLLSLQPNQTMS